MSECCAPNPLEGLSEAEVAVVDAALALANEVAGEYDSSAEEETAEGIQRCAGEAVAPFGIDLADDDDENGIELPDAELDPEAVQEKALGLSNSALGIENPYVAGAIQACANLAAAAVNKPLEDDDEAEEEATAETEKTTQA